MKIEKSEKDYPIQLKILIQLTKYNPQTKRNDSLGGKVLTYYEATDEDLIKVHQMIDTMIKKEFGEK